jgi:hypothetical protein
MGCTLTLLLQVDDAVGVVAHVGDSRAYLVREGRAHQLTQDHTFAAELARAGAIEPAAAAKHPYRNVLSRSLGTQEVAQPDLLVLDLLPGDRYLLCSDGLGNYIPDLEWLAREVGREDLEGVPEELVRFANQAGGADNITALVVEVVPAPAGADMGEPIARGRRLTALGAVPLFGELSLARQAQILAHCDELRPAAGDVLAREGELLDSLVVVVSGSCRVERAGGDPARLGPQAFTDPSPLVRPRPARGTLLAEEGCRLLRLSAQSFQRLTRARPGLGVLLLRRLARDLAGRLERPGPRLV